MLLNHNSASVIPISSFSTKICTGATSVDDDKTGLGRRGFIHSVGLFLAGSVTDLAWSKAQAATRIALPFANGDRPLVAYPQKRPLMRLTTRPPQLETPFAVFREGLITPNDAFFVRYHLANIPLSIDLASYRLNVKGLVSKPLSLSMEELQTGFPAVELVAVNQCSGNSRGFVVPRVGGGQSGNGAMGNARWRGVSLRAVLAKAGVQPGAKQVTFQGLDAPLLPSTPEFVKALPIDQALDGEVMLAFQMNGSDLPMLNGYPMRLVVPGYYGTYWVKHLSEINVIDHAFEGFFMSKAYRIPDNDCGCVGAGTAAKATKPIGKMVIRSFITSLEDGAAIRVGEDILVHGIAFDSGAGIREVQFSQDGGNSWVQAHLGEDLGSYSF